MAKPKASDAPAELTLKDRLTRILDDPGVKHQILETLSRGAGGAKRLSSTPSELMKGLSTLGRRPGIGELESIVLKIGRPVVFVRDNNFRVDGSLIPTWRERLEAARQKLEAAIPSIGRINVKNHPTYDWLGTGWLVRPNIVVTNRHVAEQFAARDATGGFPFLLNFRRRPIGASIDFRVEYESIAVNEFPLVRVLHIEGPDPAPDVAFLQVSIEGASAGALLGTPIPLSSQVPKVGQNVAVVGYPARDSRIPDPDVLMSIFGDEFDVKRLAPGEIMRIEGGILEHDASTLGGNSGSAVLDMETGEAVGLHFAGTYRHANYCVPAAVIRERLKQLGL
jgi:endonuclease G, mitochondrial